MTKRFRKLQALMKREGMTQAELGRRLGITRASVSNWFHGRRMPQYGHLVGAAEVLGVKLTELLEEDIVLAESAAEKRIIELMRSQDDADVEKIVRLIEAMLTQ